MTYPAFTHSWRPGPQLRGTLSWTEIKRELSTVRRFFPPVQVDIVRHGETVSNLYHRVTGIQDVDLTPRGREQARFLGHQLSEQYDLAICSTLRRSIETLEIAFQAGRINAPTILQDQRLCERSLGILENRPMIHVPEFGTGDIEFAPPNGESYALVARRSLSFLLDILPWMSGNGAHRLLICTHMGPMRILVGILDHAFDPASVLRQSFKNADIIQRSVDRLQLPSFLNRARS